MLVLKFGSDTRPVSPDSDSVRTKAELKFDFDILLFFGRKKGRTYVKESDLGGILHSIQLNYEALVFANLRIKNDMSKSFY